MIETITISSPAELELCLSSNVNPVLYHPIYKLDFRYRILLQDILFGKPALTKNRVVSANDKFYHYCWSHGYGLCENCNLQLNEYNAVFISHILSRSSHPEMAHDPRNHNILCGSCHHKWESTTNFEMMIFLHNQIIIKELKSEYSQNIAA